MKRIPAIALAMLLAPLGFLCGVRSAQAQSDTLPSSGSTAGVSIVSPGRSISPQSLTPTGPRTPQRATPPRPDADEFSNVSRGKSR